MCNREKMRMEQLVIHSKWFSIQGYNKSIHDTRWLSRDRKLRVPNVHKMLSLYNRA